MTSDDKKKFADGMEVLRACYPSFKPSGEDFKRTLKAYFEALLDSPFDVVRGALMRAPNPDYYPDYFPSVGQLQRVCRDVQREKATEQTSQQRLAREHAEDESESGRRQRIPTTDEGQRAYIEGGANDFEKLGRVWECESKRRGIKSWEMTPGDVSKRRFSDFWALWDRVTGGAA